MNRPFVGRLPKCLLDEEHATSNKVDVSMHINFDIIYLIALMFMVHRFCPANV